jgi:hypothetical protein
MLDFQAGVGNGEGEGGLTRTPEAEVFDGTTGLVVVIAEALAAHGRTAAAVVFGAAMTAAAGGGCGLLGDLIEDLWDFRDVSGFDCFLLIHGHSLGLFLCKILEI